MVLPDKSDSTCLYSPIMLALAISIDYDSKGTDIIETNDGTRLKCPSWPRDCESQLVAYRPSGKTCDPVYANDLSTDIAEALRTLEATGTLENRKPDWYRRLKLYAAE